MTAGYSGKPLAAKLGLKPGGRLVAIDAPAHYAQLVAPLPDAAVVEALAWGAAGPAPIIHLFVSTRAELEGRAEALAAMPPAGGAIWISWPKKTSPLHRDLTEDGVRALLLPTGWVDVKVAAVDADWSGLKFLRRRV